MLCLSEGIRCGQSHLKFEQKARRKSIGTRPVLRVYRQEELLPKAHTRSGEVLAMTSFACPAGQARPKLGDAREGDVVGPAETCPGPTSS